MIETGFFLRPRGGTPAVPRHPDFLWPRVPPRAGTFRLSSCIKTGKKFSGCAGHMGHFGTPGGGFPGVGRHPQPPSGGPKIKKKPDRDDGDGVDFPRWVIYRFLLPQNSFCLDGTPKTFLYLASNCTDFCTLLDAFQEANVSLWFLSDSEVAPFFKMLDLPPLPNTKTVSDQAPAPRLTRAD